MKQKAKVRNWSKAGFECIFQVRTNYSLFPKKEIEASLKDAPGGSSGQHQSGVELLVIGYKYCKKKYCILCALHAQDPQQKEIHMK